uniref:Uncharacterized protein n=1 Tax=Neobodo designis TaxID=312471 RepID=A0A6U4VB85_NEODS|mmetsp:Transcript_44913/g.138579  ORF Transcript_44913/g.138579 Transcript_44913/m.138579 type:complete len:107 (+) Transcript_44913:60-380(+)
MSDNKAPARPPRRNDVLERPPQDPGAPQIPGVTHPALIPVDRPPVPQSDSPGFCRNCEANQCIPAPVDMCPNCQASKSNQQGTCAKCAVTLGRCCWCGVDFLKASA